MPIKFEVHTIQDQQAAKELEKLILTSEPDADVQIDTQNHTVTIDAQASEETFKELIVSAGYSIKAVQE